MVGGWVVFVVRGCGYSYRMVSVERGAWSVGR